SLAYTSFGGINGTYNSSTGELVLSAATPMDISFFNQVLRSITYDNSSENPNSADRIVTVSVTDGDASNTAQSTIDVQQHNDAPVLHDVPGAQTVGEDTNLVISGIDITDADVAFGDGRVQVQLSVSHGTITLNPGA